ncbi:helix-turn-helix domain-containing protein [Streptomyces sp. NPDC001634]|uniref:helix-turn-helix domain-containing protein n=1 Tax=Streptomyces sp. NPDC001634 TaxID=3154390 RepID=UPI0033333005
MRSASVSWTAAGLFPEVADLLECRPAAVRAAVYRFADGGIEALPDAPRQGRPAKLLGPDDRSALAELLDVSAEAGITWSAPAVCDWLGSSARWRSLWTG